MLHRDPDGCSSGVRGRRPLRGLLLVAAFSAALLSASLGAAASALAGPTVATPPKITGKAIDEHTLTIYNGTWKGTKPFSFAYRWELCNAAGAQCSATGAETSKLRLVHTDVGLTLRAVVSVSNSEGSATVTTAASAVIAPAPPRVKVHPKVTGVRQDGKVLTASNGIWLGTPPFSYTYQWQTCEEKVCANIAGATGPTYRLVTAEIGKRIRVVVTANNAAGSKAAASAETLRILAGPPVNVEPPTISGTAIDGQTLTASTGTWAGTPPLAFAYQWRDCNLAGEECSEKPSAKGPEYTVGTEDIGKSLDVVVTAGNAHGTASATSEQVSAAGAAPRNTALPGVSGTAEEGKELAGSKGSWTGTEPILYSEQWLRCNAAGAACAEITLATGAGHTATGEDVGHTLRFQVTATNLAGKTIAVSEPSELVRGIVPKNSLAPTIAGLDIAGQTLVSTTGTWTGTEPISYTRQWERCNGAGEDCSVIEGQTGEAYTLKNEDAGHTIVVLVTASNSAGESSKASAATGEVTAPVLAPENTAEPSVTGTPQEGQELKGSKGSWTGTEPVLYGEQWLRCNAAGAGCTEILLATGSGYTATSEDVGHTLRFQVTASNTAGKATALSEPTALVKGTPPVNKLAPAVVGVPDVVGQELKSTTGTWSGSEPITYTRQWERCSSAGTECKAIGGQTGESYVLTNEDAGHTVRIDVTAHNVAGEASKESAVTGEIAGKPLNTARPTITGTAIVGEKLTGSKGTWAGAAPIAYEEQWMRCSGESCEAILLATGTSYTLTSADMGHTIEFRVKATNLFGEATASSTTTAVVTGLPSNTAKPTITTPLPATTGAKVKLSAAGTWTATPASKLVGYHWLRCSALGAECKEIAGQTGTEYTIAAEDNGHTVRIQETVSNALGEAKAESEPSGALL